MSSWAASAVACSPSVRNEYWTVTDRGPNGEIGDTRTFIVPEFTPTLVRDQGAGPDDHRSLEAIPITTPDGDPVTGLPNLPLAGDPPPYAADAVTLLDYNPNGLDTEGVVRTPDGHFWLVDEYGPSIVEVDADGHVVERHLPAGLEDDYDAAGVDYPVTGSLPADLAQRRANRGFEDVALLPDGHTIVVALQSSVVVAGDRDRIITELVEFDTATGETVQEYPYRFDAASTFAAGTRGRDLKISALIPLDQTHVVVQERTDTECRFYVVELDPDGRPGHRGRQVAAGQPRRGRGRARQGRGCRPEEHLEARRHLRQRLRLRPAGLRRR